MPTRKNPPKKTSVATKAAARKPVRKKKSKPRTWTRWILPALSLALAVYAVIRVIGYYHGEQERARNEPIRRNRATACARILEISRKGRRVHFEYLYKGIVYENWQSDYDEQFVVSRCYGVQLDSTNPVRSLLLPGTEGACNQ